MLIITDTFILQILTLFDKLEMLLAQLHAQEGYNKKVWKKGLKVAYPFIGKQLEELIERKENATMRKDKTKGKKRSIVEYEMLEECIRKKAQEYIQEIFEEELN